MTVTNTRQISAAALLFGLAQRRTNPPIPPDDSHLLMCHGMSKIIAIEVIDRQVALEECDVDRRYGR